MTDLEIRLLSKTYEFIRVLRKNRLKRWYNAEMTAVPDSTIGRVITISQINEPKNGCYQARLVYGEGEIKFPEEHNSNKKYKEFILKSFPKLKLIK